MGKHPFPILAALIVLPLIAGAVLLLFWLTFLLFGQAGVILLLAVIVLQAVFSAFAYVEGWCRERDKK